MASNKQHKKKQSTCDDDGNRRNLAFISIIMYTSIINEKTQSIIRDGYLKDTLEILSQMWKLASAMWNISSLYLNDEPAVFSEEFSLQYRWVYKVLFEVVLRFPKCLWWRFANQIEHILGLKYLAFTVP